VITINYRPLSVNKAWRGGRRYKSSDYVQFERDVLFLLPKLECLKGPIKVSYKFYLKNCKITDVDNLIKPLQDILQKAGYFEDDRFIYKIEAEKIQSDDDYIEVDIRKIC